MAVSACNDVEEKWRVWSANPAKAWTEKCFIGLSLFFWIPLMVFIVWSGEIAQEELTLIYHHTSYVCSPADIYEQFEETEYFVVGCIIAVPYVVVPLLWSDKPGHALPYSQQYWVKANVWVGIFSYMANYFWTHYFYNLLGASYTFKAWRLNNVPIALFLMTIGYFNFYFSSINVLLRMVWTARWYRTLAAGKLIVSVGVVSVLAVFTAFSETLTISGFKHYVFEDRGYAYTIGSVLYGIYFIVGFPMHYRLDEKPGKPWSVWDSAKDSFAASMIVFCLLDLWRLVIGGYGHVDNFCM